MNDVIPRPQSEAGKVLTPLLEIGNLTKSFE
ncbi:potG domain protein, partial [Erwinia amylovora]|nr:potG domain protein [Erwinia amylovora]